MKHDLHVLVAKDIDYVSEAAIGRGSLMPMIIGHDAEGGMYVYGCDFSDPAAKREILRFLKVEFKTRKIVAYSQITEAWYLPPDSIALKLIGEMVDQLPPHLRKEAARELLDRLPPAREHPDKKEAIMVSACDTTSYVMRALSFERGADDKIVRVFPNPDMPSASGEIGDGAEGAMLELLRDD